ncbi:hypothetical protein [Eubacterium maltosivorans]|uniref:hypothetical protein n=1 Tax=Eubacterium maltosivorans TaxID=2041044 RepID=UPI001A9A8058|nr:hypothetical protein [Eubacterium maltosivorans]
MIEENKIYKNGGQNMKFDLFKIADQDIELISRKIEILSHTLTPESDLAYAGVVFSGCGDGSCAQTCSGGCGHDCSAYFSECALKI